MLWVVQESIRPLLTHSHSHFGHSWPGCWWTVFGGLYTLFSVKNKGFHSNWCWNKCCLCLCLGVKDLEPSLNQNWEEPYSNGLQGKGRLIEMILGIKDTRIRANTKISVTGAKKSEIIKSLSPLLFPFSLLWWSWPSNFFLKASTPSEGVQATCPRVLNPEGIT